jgi:hypothetical protein
MSEEMNALFQRHDDPLNGECPIGFDYAIARGRAAAFAAALGQRTGAAQSNDLDVQIEDASFHSELSLPGGRLRFSAFADMIALTPDHEVAAVIVDAIQDLAPKYGYTLVPTILLETPYTGRHPGVTGIATWWIRYFDYL